MNNEISPHLKIIQTRPSVLAYFDDEDLGPYALDDSYITLDMARPILEEQFSPEIVKAMFLHIVWVNRHFSDVMVIDLDGMQSMLAKGILPFEMEIDCG